jgi:sugar/nucleoside kinase (ribokinase family)
MSTYKQRLLVIGGASFDILHLEDQTVESIGGVGMYTAMAAHRCGAAVSMLSPRPDPIPAPMQPVADRLVEWLGPPVSPDQLPGFEISYGDGKTDYLNISLGAAATAYSPELLPGDLSEYDMVHVAQKADIKMQIALIQGCRQRGARHISAGTYPVDAMDSPDDVRAVIEHSDYFFMNDFEAQAVFGSLEAAQTLPGKVLFITMGAKGVRIIQGDWATTIPAVTTRELDPTGAGDTFCGTTLAFLMQNQHPVMAARQAVALAAEMIAYVGPAALLLDEPTPEIPLDTRVQINTEQVQNIAGLLSSLPEVIPFPFTGPQYPAIGHAQTLNFFFAATLQQFGFWSVKDARYDQPLIARIGSVTRKGSDYLWAAFKRQIYRDLDSCTPAGQANLDREAALALYRSDEGTDPMPALSLHLEMAQRYGRDMLALQRNPQTLLQNALASDKPLQTLLAALDQIGGYKEDPLRKKSNLLAMIINQRPENFLPLRDDEEIAPVIDYHLQRIFLRVGLIDMIDQELSDKLADRKIVTSVEEWALRYAAYRAVETIIEQSGKSGGAVDHYFFSTARKFCLEMSAPDCQHCPLDPLCAHNKALFQPILRTSFY